MKSIESNNKEIEALKLKLSKLNETWSIEHTVPDRTLSYAAHPRKKVDLSGARTASSLGVAPDPKPRLSTPAYVSSDPPLDLDHSGVFDKLTAVLKCVPVYDHIPKPCREKFAHDLNAFLTAVCNDPGDPAHCFFPYVLQKTSRGDRLVNQGNLVNKRLSEYSTIGLETLVLCFDGSQKLNPDRWINAVSSCIEQRNLSSAVRHDLNALLTAVCNDPGDPAHCFVPYVLQKTSRGDRRVNQGNLVNKRLSEYSIIGLETLVLCFDGSQKLNPNRWMNAVSSCIEQGNLSSAVRLVCSPDGLTESSPATFNKFCSIHPKIPVDRRVFPALAPTAGCVSPAEVLRAVKSFKNGSSGGLDGLRPQHLKDVFSGPYIHTSTMISTF
ncbi:hypothetical protein HELRODRAFT_179136 [Helobdella robusta]|uniref:Uncharacterized protein n=1 Tax=Helobdella robusta TaxID=6412 RepID=T1FE80_HELRO|nr:hypothetical protein HELRODRAFT_179136 [Helobdella robusta]ESN95666.1 hypothetical protein HELRODRAFT_179136 [Helobdella robusta]